MFSLNSLTIDCKEPSIALKDFLSHETRFRPMTASGNGHAAALVQLAESGVHSRWERLMALKGL